MSTNSLNHKDLSIFDDYFIGLDCGTESVGWAVTDKNYQIPTLRGKSAWGVRLFQEGQTAAKRRVFRTTRNNMKRRKKRLNWLIRLLSNEVNKVDPMFLQSMHESKFWLEDKQVYDFNTQKYAENTDGTVKKLNKKHTLFNDSDYTDKDFHKDFPTIYHLRSFLANPTASANTASADNVKQSRVDIRHYFLAIHHILKYRGHFLFEGSKFELEGGYEELFNEFTDICTDAKLNFTDFDGIRLKEILESKDGKNDKKKKLKGLFAESEEEAEAKEANEEYVAVLNRDKVAELLAGSKVKLEDLLNQKDAESETKFSVLDSAEKIEEVLQQATSIDLIAAEIIEVCKNLVDWALLNDLMQGHKFISDSMVKRYEEHKADLQKLKLIFKVYDLDKSFFDADYAAYIGSLSRPYRNMTPEQIKQKGDKRGKKLSQSDLSKKIVKIFEEKWIELETTDEFGETIKTRNMPEDVQKIYNKAKEGDKLLPKQKGDIGRTIPYQIHYAELQEILKNMSEQYPGVLEKISDDVPATDSDDVDGYTVDCVVRRILQLHSFRIPYYVGHLNGFDDKNNDVSSLPERQKPWAEIERTAGADDQEGQSCEITPWNFDLKVKKDKSAEKFIKRMTEKCTYLRKEDVLAKNSILYSKYSLLNELNNLKIDGDRISPDVKIMLFNWFYKTKNTKTLTTKQIEKYLKENNISGSVSGLNESIKGNYSSWHDYRKVFSTDQQNDKTMMMFEQIIEWVMLLKESKDMLKKKVEKFFDQNSMKLTPDNWDAIKRLSYTGWGRFSRKFLADLKVPLVNLDEKRLDFREDEGDYRSQDISIIEAMEFGNYNQMELMANAIGFGGDNGLIAKENGASKIEGKIKYSDVDGYYASPSVKKMVWQTVKVVQELVKVAGGKEGKHPTKIMIEMARSEESKNQTSSRKKQLEKLYGEIKNDVEATDIARRLADEDESRLRSKNVYLYYTQMGKCMYCGKPIDENSLRTGNGIDIDHIYPRSKTKDDSLTQNLVLVCSEHNSKKSDIYPIPGDFRQEGLWKMLKGHKLITNEKFERLMRTTYLSDDELAKFINRQLVETRQSTKIVAELLKRAFSNTDIVYVKGNDVSEFRQHYKIIKVREMNDLHHAKDAYLNIVVGNVLHEKFTKPYQSDRDDFMRRFRPKNDGEERFEENGREREGRYSLNFHTIFGDGEWRPRKQYRSEIYQAYKESYKEHLEKGDESSKKYNLNEFINERLDEYKDKVWQAKPGIFGKKKDEIVWSYDDTRPLVIAQAKKNDVVVSEEVFESKDLIWKATVFPKGSSTGDIPLKYSDERFEDVDKYGKYSSLQTAHMVLVETIAGKKQGERTLQVMPTVIMKTTDEFRKQQLIQKHFSNEKILLNVKLNSLILWEGYPMRLRGSRAYSNAYQIYLDAFSQKYIKTLIKFDKKMTDAKKFKKELIISSRDGLSKVVNNTLYNSFIKICSSKNFINRMNNILPVLRKGKEEFSSLQTEDQVTILLQILKYLSQIPGFCPDLKLIGGTTNSGGNGAIFNVSKASSAVLITQSVTGLFEKRIDLKTIEKADD